VVLPDTSIWVAYLRPGATDTTAELSGALDRREVLTCGPVVAELIAGARPSDRQQLLASLGGLPWAGLDRRAWQSVGLLAAELRDRGQIVPLTDLEIAVAAHAANATLWTTDHDFERLAPHLEYLDLRLVG
jgi:predicted nucleic acid-binding protein